MSTAYKPLVKAVADSAGEIMESLRYGKLAVRDGQAPYEHKQAHLARMEEAERVVMACFDAINHKISPSKPARGLSNPRRIT